MGKTILFFCGNRSVSAMRKHTGICAYARSRHWDVKFIKCGKLPVSYHISIWKPDGIITDNESFSSTRIPCVYLDATVNRRSVRRIENDTTEIARIALSEFNRLGIRQVFYLPPFHECVWSDQRQKALLDVAASYGVSVSCFSKRRRVADSPVLQKALLEWLKPLPRPCGVFAANDEIAERLLMLCSLAGVKVPEDIAVVGVDDDSTVCDNTFPSLTSIAPAFVESGRLAAAALDELMNGNPSCAITYYGVLGVTRRDSTKRLYNRGSDIRDACDLIRREACSGLKARDVLKLMHGSRRSAEIRFKAEIGRSVLEEIANARLSKAEDLLANTSFSLGEIAQECGYSSSAHLRRMFERKTNMTMGAWRMLHNASYGNVADNQSRIGFK